MQPKREKSLTPKRHIGQLPFLGSKVRLYVSRRGTPSPKIGGGGADLHESGRGSATTHTWHAVARIPSQRTPFAADRQARGEEAIEAQLVLQLQGQPASAPLVRSPKLEAREPYPDDGLIDGPPIGPLAFAAGNDNGGNLV